jgi:hypothetical protein
LAFSKLVLWRSTFWKLAFWWSAFLNSAIKSGTAKTWLQPPPAGNLWL